MPSACDARERAAAICEPQACQSERDRAHGYTAPKGQLRVVPAESKLGLLRWPELQSRKEQGLIHQLTEYFLVGSFVSWLVALTSLALLAR